MRNFTIRTRNIISFGLIITLFIASSGYLLNRMAFIKERSNEIESVWLEGTSELGLLSDNILRLRIYTLRIIGATGHVDEQEKYAAEAKTLEAQAMPRLASLKNNFVDYPDISKQLNILDKVLTKYLKSRTAILADALAQREVASARMDSLNMQGNMLASAISVLKTTFEQSADAAAKDAEAQYQKIIKLSIAAILFIILLAAMIATLQTKSITTPLQDALSIATRISGGDLTQPIVVKGKDEPAKLLESFRLMQSSLLEVIAQIQQSSSDVASSAQQLQSTSSQSAANLQRQSDEVEQAATAVNQLSSAAEEVASNAVGTAQASELSEKAAAVGRQKMQETAEQIQQLVATIHTTAQTVEGLAERATHISRVLDVIRTISDQTNLLALNAAIEAARAGEHGRGFAVVSDEVRALAKRTQESTAEIEQMIGGIQGGTRHAVESMQGINEIARQTLNVAQAAESSLHDIAAAIDQINDGNRIIASASQEQAQVTKEVDRNLVNIRDLSRLSVDGAREAGQAVNALANIAAALKNQSQRFRIN